MALSGEDIKQIKLMVAVAKKGPINIAICLGKKPDKAVVLMDKRRAPAALGREAKGAGETTKVAIGKITVDGNKARFLCEDKPPSGLAKQLRGYFKSAEVPLKFEVVDVDGSVVKEEGDDADDAADNGTATANEVEIEAEAESEEDGGQSNEVDPREGQWATQWAGVQDRLTRALAQPGPAVAKLTAVRDFAKGKATAKDFEGALKALASLVSLLDAGSGQGGGNDKADGGSGEAKIDPKALVERLKQAKGDLAAVQGPLGEKLTGLFDKILGQMKTESYDQAATGLGQLEGALAKVKAASDKQAGQQEQAGQEQAGQAQAGQQDANAQETEENETENAGTVDPKLGRIGQAEAQLRKQVTSLPGGDARKALESVLDTVVAALEKGEAETALSGMKKVQDGIKLQAEIDRLTPLVAAAASSGKVADVNALTTLFNFVAGRVPAPDQAKAMGALARVEAMIAAGATQETTAFETEGAEDTKPFVQSRLNWSLTRDKLRGELGKLQDSIAQALAQEPGLEEALPQLQSLFGHIEKLDARLETKLSEIVNAEPGEPRNKLKSEARRLLAEYQSELDKPFFQAVDNDNGFVEVAVTATARSVLDDLSKVLAD